MFWSNRETPAGMSRRHFMKHAAGASALAGSSLALGNSFQVHADEMKKRGTKYGVSTMCIGMGQGVATVFELI